MIYCSDEMGRRVCADTANKKGAYKCPGCGADVILRRGKINIPHFAHMKGQSCDLVTENKMTMWHIDHQSYWPEEEREVVITYAGKKHIADIKAGNVIIEFQHSPIDYNTLVERSNFYHRFGTVVWVFDLTQKAEDRIFGYAHIWKRECSIECGDQSYYEYGRETVCQTCKYNTGPVNRYYYWKQSSRTLGQCDFKKLDKAGMKTFFQLSDDYFVHVTWNKNGVKCFSGTPMNLCEFHDYLDRLKHGRER